MTLVLKKLLVSIFFYSLKRPAYEEQVHILIQSGHVLDSKISPCSQNFSVPLRHNRPNVLYIKMQDAKDIESWLQVAKCFHIWDLDARGYHRGMWRMIYKGNPLFIIGVPFSDYAWVFLNQTDFIFTYLSKIIVIFFWIFKRWNFPA